MSLEMNESEQAILDREARRRTLCYMPKYRTDEEYAEAVKLMSFDSEGNRIQPNDWPGPPRTISEEELEYLVHTDEATPAMVEHVSQALAELEASGLAEKIEGKWAMTAAGLDALTA